MAALTPCSPKLLLLITLVGAPLAVCQAEGCHSALQAVLEEERHPDLRRPRFAPLAPQVAQVYERRDYQPLWLSGGKPSPQGQQLIELLEHAERKGLNPKDYDGDRWRERASRLPAEATSAVSCEGTLVDLGLTISAMRFLEDLRIGRVDPKALNIDFDARSRAFDLPGFVGALADSPNLGQQTATLEPSFDLYWALIDALKGYRGLGLDPALSESLPEVAKVQPGAAYKGLPALIHRLRRYGDLSPDEAARVRRDIYAEPLVKAVKRFQRRHGIQPDGVLGARTFAALNTPVWARIKQIELTLERLRWLPGDLGHRPILVNVPEFRLHALEKAADNGRYKLSLEMRVIVGESYPAHQTPLFSGKMRYLEFSPYWNVPYNILRKELHPKIQADPGYLGRHGYQIVERFGPNAVPLPATRGNIARLASGDLRLRQVPGKRNALGEVKFLFPNNHAVYLHGTPGKGLFSRDKRDFSHGCIRLQDAPRMAEHVLSTEQGWDRERIDKQIASGDWRNVTLSAPLDVYILYATAVVDRETGEVRFFDDLYGHDTKLAQALAAVYP